MFPHLGAKQDYLYNWQRLFPVLSQLAVYCPGVTAAEMPAKHPAAQHRLPRYAAHILPGAGTAAPAHQAHVLNTSFFHF